MRTNEFDMIIPRLETFTEKPEPIDWEFYKQHVAKPGFVEAFEKAVSYKSS